MTALEKLQAEARLRHISPQMLFDMQESKRLDNEGKIKREAIAEDFKEVMEMGGLLNFVYLKRYKPAKEKPVKELTPEQILKREVKAANKKIKEEQIKQNRENKKKYAEFRRQTDQYKRSKKKLVSDFLEVMEGLFFIVPADQYLFRKKQVEVKIEIKPEPSPKDKLDFNKMKKYIRTGVIPSERRKDDSSEVKKFQRPPAKYTNRNAINDYL